MKQCEPGHHFQIHMRIVCSLLLGLVLAILLLSRPVYADGGAPNLAYVAGAEQGVGMIDIAQQRMARQFGVAGNPDMLLLSPDGSLLYVTQPATGSVVALAAKTGQVICRASFPGHPALLTLSVDAAVLYVAGLNETTIQALNARTCAQEQAFQLSQPVHWIVSTLSNASSDVPRTQLWVAAEDAVNVLDDQGQVLDTIPVAGNPQFLSVPGSLTAYVATHQGSVIAIDMLTHRVIATLLTGGVFGAMDYNAVTGEIYVPDQRLRQIDVLTPVLAGMAVLPREPDSVLPVNGSPQSIAITNDGQLGFVALSNGQVAMLDIPGRSLIKTIAVGGSPHFIITGEYPPPTVPLPIAQTPPVPVLLLVVLGAILLLLGALGGFIWWRRRQSKRVTAPAQQSINEYRNKGKKQQIIY